MTVYHGTTNEFAASIMEGGFTLEKERVYHGRMSGDGIYVTTDPKNSAHWTRGVIEDIEDGVILQCELEKGLKILWRDSQIDKKVLSSLRKEFGRELLKTARVDKILPKNKQLTRIELVTLVNHFFEERTKLNRRLSSKLDNAPLWDALKPLVKYIKIYGYDGIGDRSRKYWDSDEIVIFNPSHVKAVSAHPFTAEFKDEIEIKLLRMFPALSLDQLKERAEKERLYWEAKELEWEQERVGKKIDE